MRLEIDGSLVMFVAPMVEMGEVEIEMVAIRRNGCSGNGDDQGFMDCRSQWKATGITIGFVSQDDGVPNGWQNGRDQAAKRR